MIAFLKGTVAYIDENIVVIEVNGIGYEVSVPLTAAGQLASYSADEVVEIYTYTYVREDQLALFGFMDKDSLALFKMLITVSGIGPKGALGMLSGATTDEVLRAIMTEDVKTLSKAPGIGKKTAERVILDLRDKVSRMFDPMDLEQAGAAMAGRSNRAAMSEAAEDAVQTLIALGFTKAEASQAVKKCGELPDAEAYINSALKYL